MRLFSSLPGVFWTPETLEVFQAFIIFMILLWTYSNRSMSLLYWGHQSWVSGLPKWSLTQSSLTMEKSSFLQIFTFSSRVWDSCGLALAVKTKQRRRSVTLPSLSSGHPPHPAVDLHFPWFPFCYCCTWRSLSKSTSLDRFNLKWTLAFLVAALHTLTVSPPRWPDIFSTSHKPLSSVCVLPEASCLSMQADLGAILLKKTWVCWWAVTWV